MQALRIHMIIVFLLFFCSSAMAAKPMPAYWMVVVGSGSSLLSGPGAKPPKSVPNPLFTGKAGTVLNLRCKIVGGRRAYMMWPETYANIGANTTITGRGLNRMSYEVNTGTYVGTGVWTTQNESYKWNTHGKGILNTRSTYTTGEGVSITLPDKPGIYPVTINGSVDFHFVRQTPAGKTERDEKSGSQTITFNIKVTAGSSTGTAGYNAAKQKVLDRFFSLKPGPEEASWPTYVVSPGFINNVKSVVSKTNDAHVCGAWQDTVLRMLEKMQYGTPEERALFKHMDYGPIQAYYGGHQAVVIYPKGTNWKKTGLVLDPWPSQKPETFTIANWEDRFSFGVGPSGVYKGQYPLTGGTAYPKPSLRIPKNHMKVLRRCSKKQQNEYRALGTKEQREQYINSLPANIKKSTAVSVHSPVRMLVTDARGRRVGWKDNQTFLYEIPGADVDIFPEQNGTKGLLLLLPLDHYTVKITPVKNGHFSMIRALPPEFADTPIADIKKVAVSPGTSFSITLSPENATAKLVRSDGKNYSLKNINAKPAPRQPEPRPPKKDPTPPKQPEKKPPPKKLPPKKDDGGWIDVITSDE